jgi:hypothetical protein
MAKKRTAEQLDFFQDWSPEADTLRRRMLKMNDFNVWVPLIRDKDFFDSNPQVLPLHKILSVTLDDFKELLTRSPDSGRVIIVSDGLPSLRNLGFVISNSAMRATI